MGPRVILGNKVAGSDFFDRDELLDRLWSRLPQQSVELVAPRRFGKTSVMQRLADQPRHGCRVSFVDCEAFHDPTVFLSELVDVLLTGDVIAKARWRTGYMVGAIRGFLGRIRKVEAGPGKLGLDLADPQSPRWSSSIGDLLAAARRREAPTIVILDEFSMMLDNFVRARVTPALIVNLLAWFRRLRQEQDANPTVAFVVGGSMSLEYWLRRLGATAMMNDLHREEVPPFGELVARDFVTALLESERLDWEAGVPDAILRHIDPAVPFWIQAIVWSIAPEPGRTRRIGADDVEDAYRNRLIGNAGRHYFQPFQERLERDDPAVVRGAQHILTHLAKASLTAQGAARATLAAVFAKASGLDSPEAFDALFADLQSDFYIRYDAATDRCFFAHKVLRDWWLRWHPTAAGTFAGEVSYDN